jgi:glycine cleavage system protein P-like pyridoxal-binding family
MFDSASAGTQLRCDGMKIIVTKTMENGNIDVEDVREKQYIKNCLV